MSRDDPRGHAKHTGPGQRPHGDSDRGGSPGVPALCNQASPHRVCLDGCWALLLPISLAGWPQLPEPSQPGLGPITCLADPALGQGPGEAMQEFFLDVRFS